MPEYDSNMHIILFEDHLRSAFLPLAYTRPIGDLRFGIYTLADQWDGLLRPTAISHATNTTLQQAYPTQYGAENLLINARLIPDALLANELSQLELGTMLSAQDGVVIAYKANREQAEKWILSAERQSNNDSIENEYNLLTHITDLFQKNDTAIDTEFKRLSYQRISAPLSPTVTVIGDPSRVFMEEGASVEGCWLNTTKGNIYIGKDATIMEGCVVHGPLGLCHNSTIKAGAKIYGATTIGPHSKVGGEVSNSVIQGYSNKGHDGFLGNSIIGEWCNLGADTNTSNLKNNYSDVRLWNYNNQSYQPSGLTFCGLIMGDHSKSSINSMFNTGTVVGVNANIFGSGFPPKHIPSYSWGGSEGFDTYDFDKSVEVAKRVMARRNVELSEAQISILRQIYSDSAHFRD
ncbi:MAG: GlmU family protein [Flavobacteriales bacterium]|nr:GlmU family protein [Flavobacteriales bacterium]MDG1780640.1 GlmU family protein [Flavobacteriales bacterium]